MCQPAPICLRLDKSTSTINVKLAGCANLPLVSQLRVSDFLLKQTFFLIFYHNRWGVAFPVPKATSHPKECPNLPILEAYCNLGFKKIECFTSNILYLHMPVHCFSFFFFFISFAWHSAHISKKNNIFCRKKMQFLPQISWVLSEEIEISMQLHTYLFFALIYTLFFSLYIAVLKGSSFINIWILLHWQPL